MRRNAVLILMAMVFSLSLLGTAWAQSPIKIGALYPLSGRPALFGKDSVAAAEIAVDEVNQAGGVLKGRKLELLVTDSRANPQESVKIAERYIMQEKVSFLYGIVSSAVGLAVTEVAKKHQKILITTDCSSTQLTMEKWHPCFFRVSINSYQAGRTAAMLAQYKPWKNYYVIGADYEGPHSLWENMFNYLKALRPDVKLIGEGWPKLGEPDYQSYITAAIAAKPDILFMALWGGDAVAFLKQAKQYNLFSRMDFMATEIGGDYGVFEALGTSLPDGLMMSARYHPYFPKTEANRKFVEKFHKKTGRYPGYVADGAYTGIKVIAKAVEMAKTADDTQKLIKAMEGLEIIPLSNPEGVVSRINPADHQMSFWHAIGFTTRSDEYPPAKTILGNFFCIPTPEPTKEELNKARAKK